MIPNADEIIYNSLPIDIKLQIKQFKNKAEKVFGDKIDAVYDIKIKSTDNNSYTARILKKFFERQGYSARPSSIRSTSGLERPNPDYILKVSLY